MPPGDMTDPQLRLRTYLEGAPDFAGKLPTEYCYRNVYDFVLREGRFFEAQPRPGSVTLRQLASVGGERSWSNSGDGNCI